jgi:hypothetical protein
LLEKLERSVGTVTPLKLEKGTLTAEAGKIKASFFHYPYPLVRPVQAAEGLAPLASLLEIALMKLTAIADRGARKDFVDLVFILRSGVTSKRSSRQCQRCSRASTTRATDS